MSDIFRQTAREIVLDWMASANIRLIFQGDEREGVDALIDCIAVALENEREACAALADTFVWYDVEGCQPDRMNETIAASIRARMTTAG